MKPLTKPLATFTALVTLLLGLIECRAESTNAALPTISALQATNYIGKQVIVTGVVAQVSARPGIFFLNFEKRYPDSPFAAVIRARNTNEFENLTELKGKSVSVQGQVRDYKGKPEMELSKKSQLKLLSAEK